jgi:hypothetical protein
MARNSSPRPVATGPAHVIGAPPDGLAEHASAYRAARQEIDLLPPGETILYHEGYLALDAAKHPAIAGRAAAFLEAATERAEGVLAQRRVRAEWYRYVFRKSQP